MLLSTAVCAIFSLGQHGVALVGHFPAGLSVAELLWRVGQPASAARAGQHDLTIAVNPRDPVAAAP